MTYIYCITIIFKYIIYNKFKYAHIFTLKVVLLDKYHIHEHNLINHCSL